MPKGQKRPAGTVGAAVVVARVATSEIKDEKQEKSRRIKSGKAGACARAKYLTAEQRKAIAQKAAAARWA